MKRLFPVLLILAFLTLSVGAWAAVDTHYVTQAGAGDQNGTSLANAWAVSDFNNAAKWDTDVADDNKIGPGDTVYFSGTITTGLDPQGSGTSGNPIIIDGYAAGDCDPITECDDSGTCSGGAGSAALISGSGTRMTIDGGVDYITVQDFRMTGGGSTVPIFMLNSSVATPKSDNITVKRNYLYNANGALFWSSRTSASPYTGSAYLTVENNKMVGYGVTGDPPGGVYFYYNTDLIVRNNEFAGGLDPAASNCASDNVVEVHVVNNGLFEYNDIWGAYQQTGIAIKEPSPYNHNVIVRFNKVHDNGLLSSKTNGQVMGIKLEADPSYIYIYGNIVYKNGNFGIGVSRGSSYIYIWSNVIADNGWSGISTWVVSGETFGTCDNVYIYNNTISRSDFSDDDINRAGIVFSDNGTARVAKNNIFYYNRPTETTYQQIYAAPGTEAGITLDYNGYYFPSQTPTVYWQSDYRTIPTMVFSYTQETNGEVADPGFTDPNGADNTYGTVDDNYTLDGSNINDGADLSGCFNVSVQGTGYVMCYDDGLDPVLTDWTTTPQTVEILKRDTYGWSRGAYVYSFVETDNATWLNSPTDPLCYISSTHLTATDSDGVSTGHWAGGRDRGVKILRAGGYPNGCTIAIRGLEYLGDISAKTYTIEEVTLDASNNVTGVASTLGTISGAVFGATSAWYGININEALAEGNGIRIKAPSVDSANILRLYASLTPTVVSGAAADLQYLVWGDDGAILAGISSSYDLAIKITESDEVIVPPATTCDLTYDTSALTVDGTDNIQVGRYSASDFYGFLYTPAANECVCKIDPYIYSETGTPAGNYYARIFVYNGATGAIDSIAGTSSAVAGAGINGQGGQWSSASAGTYDFDPCISLSTGTTYAITWFISTDADLTDDPEYDGTNYWAIGTDDNAASDAIQLGRGSWQWDAEIPYPKEAYVPDAASDALVKIYTETDAAEVIYQIRCKATGDCTGPYKEGETIGPFEVVCSAAPTLSDVTAVTMTLTDGTHTTTVAGTTVSSTIVNFAALTVPATWDGPISATGFTLNGSTWVDAGAQNMDLTAPTNANIDDLCSTCEVDAVADAQTSWTGVTTDAATFTDPAGYIDILLTLPDTAGYIISAAPTWPRVAVVMDYPATGAYAYYVSTASAQTYTFRIYLGPGYRDADGIALTGALLLADGTFTDQAGNAISTTLAATPLSDKTYVVAVPFDSSNPLQISDTGAYATITAAQAAFALLPDDNITVGTMTDTPNAGAAGTAGHPITVTFDSSSTVATGAWTLDQNYWTVNGNDGQIVGDVTVTGTNVIIDRMLHNSTVTLGVDNVHSNSLIPTGDSLVIPEGATGVAVYNDTIAGTLTVAETCALLKNIIAVTVDLSGLGAGETVTFANSVFTQSKAAIEATSGGGTFTCGDPDTCQYEQSTATLFIDVSGDDYRIPTSSICRDAGITISGNDADLIGTYRPTNTAYDIGAYEFKYYYTKGDYASLPTDDTDLSIIYSLIEIENLDSTNGTTIYQYITSNYSIHQYREVAGTSGTATSGIFTWNGQSNYAPSSSVVTMQIYNFNTASWETIDTDNATAASTNFTLYAVVSNLTNYKNANNETVVRVWQLGH